MIAAEVWFWTHDFLSLLCVLPGLCICRLQCYRIQLVHSIIGEFGGSYRFRNLDNSYAKMDNKDGKLAVNSFTFSAWIKSSSGYVYLHALLKTATATLSNLYLVTIILLSLLSPSASSVLLDTQLLTPLFFLPALLIFLYYFFYCIPW